MKGIEYTYDYIQKYISQTGCILISEKYENAIKNLTIQCKCGNIFERSFGNFTKSHYCNDCTGVKKRLDKDAIEQEIKNINSKIQVIDVYKENKNYFIKSLCSKCGKAHNISLRRIRKIEDSLCSECTLIKRGKSKRNSDNEILEQIKEIHGTVDDVLEIITSYKKPTKIKFICKCGEITYRTLNGLKRSNNFLCDNCNRENKKEMFKLSLEEVKTIVKNEKYNLLEDNYINARTPLKMKCENNHICYISLDNFHRGNCRCTICNESKGEKKIRNYLENNKFSFQSQYDKLENLVGINGKPLRFDFAVFYDKNRTKLSYLIEYDGIFHYEKQYDDDGFETIQIHDKRKNEYCKNNNIELIRIPYWEFENIDSILLEKINKNKVKEAI